MQVPSNSALCFAYKRPRAAEYLSRLLKIFVNTSILPIFICAPLYYVQNLLLVSESRAVLATRSSLQCHDLSTTGGAAR